MIYTAASLHLWYIFKPVVKLSCTVSGKQNKRTLYAVLLDSGKECVYRQREPEVTTLPSANHVSI